MNIVSDVKTLESAFVIKMFQGRELILPFNTKLTYVVSKKVASISMTVEELVKLFEEQSGWTWTEILDARDVSAFYWHHVELFGVQFLIQCLANAYQELLLECRSRTDFQSRMLAEELYYLLSRRED